MVYTKGIIAMKPRMIITAVMVIFITAGVVFLALKGNRDITKSPDTENVKSNVLNEPAAVSPKESEKPLPQNSKFKSLFKVTFVELGSVKCIPCKKMQPIMKEIEEEYSDQVKVIFHDVWTPDGKTYGMKYRIRVIPTQIFLDKNGNEYFRHEGFFPKEELIKVLEQQGVK